MIKHHSCEKLNVNTVHLHHQEDTVLRRTELSPNHRPGGGTGRKRLLLPEVSDPGGSPSKSASAVPSQCPLSHARHAGKEGRDGDTCSWVSGVLQTQGVGTPTEPGRSPMPGPLRPEKGGKGACVRPLALMLHLHSSLREDRPRWVALTRCGHRGPSDYEPQAGHQVLPALSGPEIRRRLSVSYSNFAKQMINPHRRC